MRVVILMLAAVAMLSGCWEKKVKNLSDAEFDHYYALRSFMDEDQKKVFLKLKTEEERNAYLKELGLWEMFYRYTAEEREAIVAGDVEVGWTKDKVLMAWGAPFDRKKLVGREAQRSEMLIYRFEEHEGGLVRVWEPGSKTEYKAIGTFQKNVILDDDKVAEIQVKEDWD